MNWVDAAKGKTAASCPFEYAARLTEVMLLGVVALRAGKKIDYDAREHARHERRGGERVSQADAAVWLVGRLNSRSRYLKTSASRRADSRSRPSRRAVSAAAEGDAIAHP